MHDVDKNLECKQVSNGWTLGWNSRPVGQRARAVRTAPVRFVWSSVPWNGHALDGTNSVVPWTGHLFGAAVITCTTGDVGCLRKFDLTPQG